MTFFIFSFSGIYECQISTTPPVGHFVYLTVVGELNSANFFSFTTSRQLENEFQHVLT